MRQLPLVIVFLVLTACTNFGAGTANDSIPFANVPRSGASNLKGSVIYFRGSIANENWPGATSVLSSRCRSVLGSGIDSFLGQLLTEMDGQDPGFKFSQFDQRRTSGLSYAASYRFVATGFAVSDEVWSKDDAGDWFLDDCDRASKSTGSASSSGSGSTSPSGTQLGGSRASKDSASAVAPALSWSDAGLSHVPFGATVDQALATVSPVLGATSPTTVGCWFQVQALQWPELQLTFGLDGRLDSVTVLSDRVRTASGLGFGSIVGALRRSFPDVVVERVAVLGAGTAVYPRWRLGPSGIGGGLRAEGVISGTSDGDTLEQRISIYSSTFKPSCGE